MNSEYGIFAPIFGCVYLLLGMVILIGIFQNIGEWVDYLDYLIGAAYTIYKGDY